MRFSNGEGGKGGPMLQKLAGDREEEKQPPRRIKFGALG